MYRERLLGTGLIEAAGHGLVTISFPYLRDYLRTHIVTEAANDSLREDFPRRPNLTERSCVT